jgi:hypothetical protein
MEPYRHEDDEHDWLTVAEHDGRPGTALVRCNKGGVEVTPEKIPAITAALYEACGLESPVVVELPEVDTSKPHGIGPFRLSLADGGVRVEVVAPAGPVWMPCELRDFAAVAAAYAAAADAEPDPADVEELAAVMRADHPAYLPRTFEDDARTALRWMTARKAAAS